MEAMDSILDNSLSYFGTPKGNFQAKGVEGAYFPLGHYKSYTNTKGSALLYNSQLMMHHSQDSRGIAEFDPKPNMSETRFKKGFYRRSANHIINPITEECKAYSNSQMDKKVEYANRRTEFLRSKETLNGYNVITGEKYNNFQDSKQTGRKQIKDGMSSFTLKQGQNILRESAARYHAPLGSGPKFEYRQNILLNEGVFTDRCSSIIELGKKDLLSYGVEDQFSKSEYYPNNVITRTGLYEAREPGRYTPKKIKGHPAGVPEIVENWTKTIDINNNSLQGRL